MVSVVIPVYNEEKALPHTLRELLRQPGDYEVIAVDWRQHRSHIRSAC